MPGWCLTTVLGSRVFSGRRQAASRDSGSRYRYGLFWGLLRRRNRLWCPKAKTSVLGGCGRLGSDSLAGPGLPEPRCPAELAYPPLDRLPIYAPKPRIR